MWQCKICGCRVFEHQSYCPNCGQNKINKYGGI